MTPDSPENGARRFFKRLAGNAAQTFTEHWTLGAGDHEIVARLIRPDETVQENAIRVTLDPGQTRELSLEALRFANAPIVWHLQDSNSSTLK